VKNAEHIETVESLYDVLHEPEYADIRAAVEHILDALYHEDMMSLEDVEFAFELSVNEYELLSIIDFTVDELLDRVFTELPDEHPAHDFVNALMELQVLAGHAQWRHHELVRAAGFVGVHTIFGG
jgi:hypothetical protein